MQKGISNSMNSAEGTANPTEPESIVPKLFPLADKDHDLKEYAHELA